MTQVPPADVVVGRSIRAHTRAALLNAGTTVLLSGAATIVLSLANEQSVSHPAALAMCLGAAIALAMTVVCFIGILRSRDPHTSRTAGSLTIKLIPPASILVCLAGVGSTVFSAFAWHPAWIAALSAGIASAVSCQQILIHRLTRSWLTGS